MLSETGFEKHYDSPSDDSQGFLCQELTAQKFSNEKSPPPSNEDFKAADVFALGVCSYHLWLGVHPFRDPRRPHRVSDREIRIVDGLPPTDLVRVTDIEAAHFFQTCLSHDPKQVSR